MQTNESFSQKPFLRAMHLDDIPHALGLSTAAGWNQTEDDWKFILQDPLSICLVAVRNHEIIGTTTAINYSGPLAWIGMVLVHQQHRGQGISKLLLTRCLEKINCNTKLDATPEGQYVYKKFGFREEYSILRMLNPTVKLSHHQSNIQKPEPFQDKDLPSLIEFDRLAFGANRATLIQYLTNSNLHKAWVLKQNDQLTGFALGRKGTRYNHIGPVEALNIEDVKLLIGRALKDLVNQPVICDVLADKQELIEWLKNSGFSKQRDFVRMYRKENTCSGESSNMFLIAGPEFG